MCGITGFFDFQHNTTRDTVAKMSDAMPHRGPDGQGEFFEETERGNVGLGHRRLSIIDLSHSADQPMYYKNLVIVFNGEIYNYREIKEELSVKGHQFNTGSDTEMILHAFEEWQEKCVQRFIGMFAFVIYDRAQQKAWLFRDRTGIKPLYYCKQDGHLLFASELKCFHEYSAFNKKLNREAVVHFLQYGYLPIGISVFEDVHKLQPGHYAIFDLANRELITTKYWDAAEFYAKPKQKINLIDAVSETEKLVRNACEYRMVSDVPVGVFLSGGYDSTLVTALLQKDRTEKIKTFTIGVEDKNLNEAVFAADIAKRLGTEHTEMYCTEDEMLPIVEQIPFFYDEPFGDSSAVPTMLVSKTARKNVTVALSADGGDEVFGGYNRYDYISKLSIIQKFAKLPLPYDCLISHLMKNVSDAYRLKTLFKNPSAYQLADVLNTSYRPSELQILFKNDFTVSTKRDFDNMKIKGDLNRMMYYDYVTYLPDDILTKVDRATMSASLEGREPLLDHRILEWAATLPNDLKYHNGQKKYILKKIVHQYIPQDIMDRPKMGFGVPVKKWLTTALSDQLDYYLGEQFVKEQDIFNFAELHRVRQNVVSGKEKHYQKLWYILMFQMWYERWMR